MSNRPKACPSITYHPHRDGSLLFDPKTRQIFGLNPVASICWLAWSKGDTSASIQQKLAAAFTIDTATSQDWVMEAIAAFEKFGLQENEPEPGEQDSKLKPATNSSPENVEEHLHYQTISIEGKLLELNFCIRVVEENSKALTELLKPLLCGFDSEAPAIFVDITDCEDANTVNIKVDGCLKAENVEKSHLATTLEGVLVTAALAATPHLMALHAALVAPSEDTPGKGVMLMGESGSGKSTLALALCAKGWLLGGDDIAVLTKPLDLLPVHLDPCVKNEGFGIIADWFPEIKTTPSFDRFGRNARFVPFNQPRVFKTEASIIVFPRYISDNNSCELIELDGAAGLSLLLEQCLSVSDDFSEYDVGRIADWHETISYFALLFSDVEQAASCIVELHGG